jgi:hypothetical protein
MKRFMPLLGLMLFAPPFPAPAQQVPQSTVTVVDEWHVVPVVLRDPKTKILYILESDGRHISAITPAGKLLWSRNPFVDKKLSTYRLVYPLIVYFDFPDPAWWKIHRHLGPVSDFIAINFNSSQFGAVNKKTGDFTFFGQD